MSEPVVAVDQVRKTFRYRPYAPGTLTLKSAILDAVLFRRRPAYVTVEALQDVSLRVDPGQTVGLIGPNGAGKTTLLRLIAGVYQPDQGSVRVRGRCGTLLDLGSGFHPDLSGYENAQITALIAGIPPAEFATKVDAIAAFAELEDALQAPVRTYSMGMRLRLGFSVIAGLEPELLIVDEALAVGDAAFQLKCRTRIEELRAGGTALLVASHDLATTEQLCDHVVRLDHGRVVAAGDPAEVCPAYQEAMTGEAAQS